MAETYALSDVNPNNAIGGGGCVCNPLSDRDCVGPFAIFNAIETDSGLSPHVVLSLGCAKSFVRKVERGGELLRTAPDDQPNEAPDEPVL